MSIKSHGEFKLIFQLQYFNKAFSAKKQQDKFILWRQTQFLNCLTLQGYSSYISYILFTYLYNNKA